MGRGKVNASVRRPVRLFGGMGYRWKVFVGHFDQSVAHNKKTGNALVCLLCSYTQERAHTHTYMHAPQVATNVGMFWGGKQAILRESTVLPDRLGDSKPKMYFIPGAGSGEWQDGPKWVDGPCPGAVEKDMSLSLIHI